MKKLKLDELNRLTVDEFKKSKKKPVVFILDNIRSANNVGSAFRTADAFAVDHLFLCGITAAPPHRDIQKTAIGATESVDWSHHKETLEVINHLKNDGYKIYSVEQCEGSIDLSEINYSKTEKIAFIFGNEVMGVQQQVVDSSDACLEIPQWGTKHSLNISVSVGIVIWDYIFKTK